MFALQRKFVNLISAGIRACSSSATVAFEEVRVPVPWGHIAVKQWGDPSLPAVLCCHGYMDNAGTFDTLIPHLVKRFSYLCLDLPGHGHSSHAHAGLFYTDDFYTLSIEYVRRHIGMEKIGLMGHSMGASLNLLYCLWQRARVDFSVGFEAVALPENPVHERIFHIGRRIDKIMAQENRRGKDPMRPKEMLLKGLIAAYAGSLDQRTAEILLERAVEEANGLARFSRDIKCQNNQVFGQNTNTSINLLSEPQDIKMCFIEVTDGFRFLPHHLAMKTMHSCMQNYGLVEHHVIAGRHHEHLSHPENVAPIINNFLDKITSKNGSC